MSDLTGMVYHVRWRGPYMRVDVVKKLSEGRYRLVWTQDDVATATNDIWTHSDVMAEVYDGGFQPDEITLVKRIIKSYE